MRINSLSFDQSYRNLLTTEAWDMLHWYTIRLCRQKMAFCTKKEKYVNVIVHPASQASDIHFSTTVIDNPECAIKLVFGFGFTSTLIRKNNYYMQSLGKTSQLHLQHHRIKKFCTNAKYLSYMCSNLLTHKLWRPKALPQNLCDQ